MANSTLSSVAYVFQHMYDTGLADESMRLHPTLDGIPKSDDFGGDAIVYAVKVGNAQNITSGAITLAQAVGTASKGFQFTMNRKIKRGTISLDVEALEAAKLKPGNAFAELVVTEVDGFVAEFSDRLGFDLFRDATGNRGQVQSINGNTVTLVTPDDARNFKFGMQGAAAQNADGSSLRTGTSSVTAVDTDAGTVTFLSVASIVGLSPNDFLFAAPEIGGNIEGMELCNPFTAPASNDSFRGVNRSVLTALLAGTRINDTTTFPEENIGKLAAKIAANGGTVDRCALNPQRWWEMARRLGAKILYSGGGGTAEYGFESIKLAAPSANGRAGGMIDVVPDADCPMNRTRVFNNASHRIRSLKPFVHIGNEDGLYELRLNNDDALETRVRSMSNYQQTKPRDFGVASI